MTVAQAPIVDEQLLSTIVRRIRAVGEPLSIVLFGSHARRDAGPESDLDLLIVEEHSDVPPHKRGTRYWIALKDIRIPKDIVVYTQQEIDEWSRVPMAFITTIAREGKVLYERPA